MDRFFRLFKCFLRKHDWSDPYWGDVYCYRCGVSYDFYELRIKSKEEDDEYATIFVTDGNEPGGGFVGVAGDASSPDSGGRGRGRGAGHGKGRGKGHGKGRGKGHSKHK